MIKRNFYGREKYRLKVRVRKANKYGVYKDTFTTSKYATTFQVGEYILVDLNSKIYDKLFNEMKKDELIAYFDTEEVKELLTEMIDSSIIKGKNRIAIPETERVFREIVFDKIYTLFQNEKVLNNLSKKDKEVDYNSFLDFEIPNQFEYLNLTKKLY